MVTHKLVDYILYIPGVLLLFTKLPFRWTSGGSPERGVVRFKLKCVCNMTTVLYIEKPTDVMGCYCGKQRHKHLYQMQKAFVWRKIQKEK